MQELDDIGISIASNQPKSLDVTRQDNGERPEAIAGSPVPPQDPSYLAAIPFPHGLHVSHTFRYLTQQDRFGQLGCSEEDPAEGVMSLEHSPIAGELLFVSSVVHPEAEAAHTPIGGHHHGPSEVALATRGRCNHSGRRHISGKNRCRDLSPSASGTVQVPSLEERPNEAGEPQKPKYRTQNYRGTHLLTSFIRHVVDDAVSTTWLGRWFRVIDAVRAYFGRKQVRTLYGRMR